MIDGRGGYAAALNSIALTAGSYLPSSDMISMVRLPLSYCTI